MQEWIGNEGKEMKILKRTKKILEINSTVTIMPLVILLAGWTELKKESLDL